MGVLPKVCLGSQLFIAHVTGELLFTPILLHVSFQVFGCLATEITLDPESRPFQLVATAGVSLKAVMVASNLTLQHQQVFYRQQVILLHHENVVERMLTAESVWHQFCHGQQICH